MRTVRRQCAVFEGDPIGIDPTHMTEAHDILDPPQFGQFGPVEHGASMHARPGRIACAQYLFGKGHAHRTGTDVHVVGLEGLVWLGHLRPCAMIAASPHGARCRPGTA